MVHHEDDIDIITDIDTDPYLPEEPDKYNDSDMGNKFDEDGNIGDDVYVVFMMYHMVRVRSEDWGRWYVRNRFLLDGRGKDELTT